MPAAAGFDCGPVSLLRRALGVALTGFLGTKQSPVAEAPLETADCLV